VAEPGYAGRVVADVTQIAGTASGRLLLERIRASGHRVVIEKPAETDPLNASVRPDDLRAAIARGVATGETDAGGQAMVGSGAGSDCIVTYDPRQWPNPVHPAVPSSDALLFAMLNEALAQLRGEAQARFDRAGDTLATDTEAVARYRRELGDG
jgi:hypothetical protein